MFASRLAQLFFAAILSLAQVARGQVQDANDTIRVRVAINADGTRTTYQSEPAKHKATATQTGSDGRIIEKIRYELDDAGRSKSGRVFGPDDRLRFKALYKYDAAGRVTEEKQLNNDESVRQKIVYSYDQRGKPSGYSIYDAAGKMIGPTSAPSPTPTASPKARLKSPR
jgi:hypothetical protein